jgi:hypothetical protein
VSDPLEEREDLVKEVADKRIVEAMDEAAQTDQLRALLEDENVRDLVWRVMGWCGIFTDPMNSNFGNVAYGLGKAAIGKKLLVEINLANPQAWLAMQLKAAAIAAEEAKAAALKRLRKGRST